jgi:hypothetical protein
VTSEVDVCAASRWHISSFSRKKSFLYGEISPSSMRIFSLAGGKHTGKRGEMKIASMLHCILFPFMKDVCSASCKKEEKIEEFYFDASKTTELSFGAECDVVDIQKCLNFIVHKNSIIPKSFHRKRQQEIK